ncbi:MAG: diaminopimelate dehydrogenase [Clostridia bacterium]|nr:diaminopimelate dehydrogenase [Clostridia bacterium]
MLIRVGIYGYGNLGKGVESALRQNADMELTGIFTRRDPKEVPSLSGAPVYPASEADSFRDKIDVMILCGGSATDLPVMTARLAERFHVVDSFDTHADIPGHFASVDRSAKASGHVALISGGWDPGVFSLMRLYGEVFLPDGQADTFWGPGVSQGHSDAVRRIPGVKDARQYTLPVEESVRAVRAGEMPELTARQKHRRLVYAVAEEGADREAIRKQIVSMPHYFDGYDTEVFLIGEEEMKENHSRHPHGGFVFRTGRTGLRFTHRETMECGLHLDSNPEFTGSVLCALARGVYRLAQRGESGCRTIFDLPPAYLSPSSPEDLRARLL